MRVFPRAGRRTRIAVLALLGCVPGLAAVLVAVLCAPGADHSVAVHLAAPAPASPEGRFRAPRPPIVPRSAWLDATVRRTQPPPRYDDKVVAVFVHHTDSPNGYSCAQVPEIIRRLYSGQTGDRAWDDIGYNFLVDRCGTIYEGRAGGTERAVVGAHTQGFNHRTAGIAALGTFTAGVPVPRAMADSIAAVAAWKLGLADVDPRTSARLVSSNGRSRYRLGTVVALPAVAAHQDGYRTNCPGAALIDRLPEIREAAARLQGRAPRTPPPATPRPAAPTAPVPAAPTAPPMGTSPTTVPGTIVAIPPGTATAPSESAAVTPSGPAALPPSAEPAASGGPAATPALTPPGTLRKAPPLPGPLEAPRKPLRTPADPSASASTGTP
ncbi:N-acetylmuramoyl-L-alanine amidase [Streptomyces sp. NPDC101237]|uniref:peptidoglycan recognition protein family protein n=1 Tax=Streptomyces sp. NPDC101237 TaxID=3366139 RepID=UPI00382C4B6E